MSIRALCLSDLHGRLPDLSSFYGSVDLAILAGDICDKRQSITEQRQFFYDELIPWICRAEYNGIDIVGTWGNHDEYAHQLYCEDRMGSFLQQRFLIGESRTIAGSVFYGCPFSIARNGGGVFRGRDNFEGLGQIFQRVPRDVNILITHTPPYGILDYSDDGDIGKHCGSKRLLYRLEKNVDSLTYCIFGHIHNMGSCTTRINRVNYVNASVRGNGKDVYRPEDEWVKFALDSSVARWYSKPAREQNGSTGEHDVKSLPRTKGRRQIGRVSHQTLL